MNGDPYTDCVYFDQLICHHRDAITNRGRITKCLVCAGLTVLVASGVIWVLSARGSINVNLAPSVVAIIGIVLNGASLVPYKDISPAKLKILRYQKMKEQCERIKDLPDAERRAQLKDFCDYLKELD